ncbi:MAG: histidinol dehydrogenase, partial [Caulobacteraceae bacterium]|nr:histidinol dehydrogenase [Caulobacteraceae bacterium]
MTRTSVVRCDPDAFERLADAGEALARVEGLPAHGLSMSLRRRLS